VGVLLAGTAVALQRPNLQGNMTAMPQTPPPPPPPAIVQPANPIGCNLDGNVDYNTAHVWADAGHAFRPWGKVNRASEPNPGLPVTEDGYPQLDADSLSYLNDYPDGVYHLSWSGAGEVVIAGMGHMSNEKRRGDNVSADVLVRHDNPDGTGGMIFLGVRNVAVNNAVHNIHLWSPSYGPGEPNWGKQFSDDFIRHVRPFASIRFMDWAGTNNSPVARWEDRAQPTAMIQTFKGIAWEFIIDLANTVHRDVWINIPDQATDDYVQHLAALFHDKLDPSLKIRVEYSNEVWNGIFQQFHHNLERAKQNDQLNAHDDFGRAAQQYGLRAAEVIQIFQTVFANQGDRVIGVYGGQNSNIYWADTGLNQVKKSLGEPNKFFKEIAIAPYDGNDLGPAPGVGWDMDSLFANLEEFNRTKLASWIRDAHKESQKWGMNLVAYESGQHVVGNGTLNDTIKQAANNNPRMYTLYHHMYETWKQSGGGLYNCFSHIGGGWGLLDDIRLPGSPKWDAVMDLLLPKGDATLDGHVTWDDFQKLKANWHQSHRYWSQGDFNGDNIVDEKDLDLMLPNLTNLTDDQRKEVEALRRSSK
jgi:hypothetical protein